MGMKPPQPRSKLCFSPDSLNDFSATGGRAQDDTSRSVRGENRADKSRSMSWVRVSAVVLSTGGSSWDYSESRRVPTRGMDCISCCVSLESRLRSSPCETRSDYTWMWHRRWKTCGAYRQDAYEEINRCGGSACNAIDRRLIKNALFSKLCRIENDRSCFTCRVSRAGSAHPTVNGYGSAAGRLRPRDRA